jgi:phage shock protein PspC (stress-responsive transcriptional regulator)
MSLNDELKALGELHERGVLTDEEFAHAKAKVLSAAPSTRAETPAADALNRFRRSRNDRWLGGVCGGIAEVTDVPAWMWRLAFAALLVCAGTGLMLYLLLWIFVPEKELPAQRTDYVNT